MSLPAHALRRPVTVVAATLSLVLLGAVSLARLPVSLLPDVTLPVLTIRTRYPGAAAPEVARFIAEPIEEAIAATTSLVELRSVSRNGEATTVLRFAWGTDMRTAVLDVRERLDNTRGRLPERAERPTLLTSDPGERPIALLALSGPGDLRATARTAGDVHARRMEQLDGVASVAVVGAPQDEIRIELDANRLRALNLAPDDIARAVREANVGAPGGTVRRGQFRFSIRALTEFSTVEEIASTSVAVGNATVQLANLGTVTVGAADPASVVRLDGASAVGLVVYKDAGVNTVAVTRAIHRALDDLRAEFPALPLTVVAAQAGFVTDALANLAQEIVAGGLLALLVILVLMRDVRSSLAVALIVPLSVLVSLSFLQALDVTINVLSLGGLALGVGLLVDNAIVVAEAAGRYREGGEPLVPAARHAAEEVAGPLIAGTLTTLLVFGPVVFVRGLGAALFRDLALSVVVTVGASLILALTLMPVLTVGFVGYRSGMTARPARRSSPWVRFLDRLEPLGHRAGELYELGMAWCLVRPRTVMSWTVGAVAVTAVMTWRLPREVLPLVDEGLVVAQLRLPEGTTLKETTRHAGRIAAAARDQGATGVYARVGVATDEEILVGADQGSSATAQLLIPVPQGTSAARFAAALRTAVPDLAEGALALDLAGQSEFGGLIGRGGRVIQVEVTAQRPNDAERWIAQARTAMRGLSTLADVRDPYAATQPVIEVALERDRIARRGLEVERVAQALAGGLGGLAASELRETDRRTPITVRFAGDAHEDLQAALATVVAGVPVGQLVSVREIRAPIEVVRVGQRPVTLIEAVVERGGTARAVRDVRRTLERLATPPGVTWRLGGADEERRRTAAELNLVALLAVALVFLVLAGEFASFTTPLVVMLTVPLAAAGSLVALWVTGQSLNVVSLIGIVVMIGLADNEAVVKLAAIRRFRSDGHTIADAVRLGGRQRLRAITMTSLTTIAGVLPLALGVGAGGALYRPLAAAVIGGSVTALGVTLFVMPTAYAAVERWKTRQAL